METVVAESSVNEVADVAQTAWAAVCATDLDKWEGTLTVPDIRPDLFDGGAFAGSGMAVKVSDSRYGMWSVALRVRQLMMDLNACTTALTLSNHSLAYSSGLSDTAALAICSADVATGANSITLFNTQYVRVKTSASIPASTSGNTVQGVKSNGGLFDCGDVRVMDLPTGRRVFVACAPADGNGHTTLTYDVVAIKVNGVTVPIPQSRRPDYYLGQYLVVNVDCSQ